MNLKTVQKSLILRRILGALAVCLIEIVLYTLCGWLILEVFERPVPQLLRVVLFIVLAVPAALIVSAILNGEHDDLLRQRVC